MLSSYRYNPSWRRRRRRVHWTRFAGGLALLGALAALGAAAPGVVW